MKHVFEDSKENTSNPVSSTSLLAFWLSLHTFIASFTPVRLADYVPIDNVEHVLDVACGPSSWVLDMAHNYRDNNFFGIDRDPAMVRYARSTASVSDRNDILFAVGNMHALSPRLDACFDVVHARFVKEATAMRQWPTLLKGLLRLCHPGGYVILTECNYPVTSRTACQHLFDLLQQAIVEIGGTPNLPTGIEALARNSGWCEVRSSVTSLALSAQTPAYAVLLSQLEPLLSIAEQFLLRICSKAAFARLRRAVIAELYDETFSSTWSLNTLVGRREDVPYIEKHK